MRGPYANSRVCVQLHPAYKIFLLYFAGVSNDCYARGMYSRSPLIPSTLDEAEEFFTRAQALICEARILTPHSFLPKAASEDRGDDSDDGSSSRSLHMHRSRHSEDTTSRPSTAATSISAFSTDTDILFFDDFDDECDAKLSVSPLNVRKYQPLPETPSKLPTTQSTSLFSQPSTSPETATSRPNPRLASFYLLRFPPSEPPPEPTPPIPTSFVVEEDIPYPDEDTCFHEPDHVEIYSSQLASFAEMIASHIASLRRFRAQSQALAASTWALACRDGNGKRQMSPEERMERIVRGRERKWARPRFDPMRYRELCELAIAEL